MHNIVHIIHVYNYDHETHVIIIIIPLPSNDAPMRHAYNYGLSINNYLYGVLILGALQYLCMVSASFSCFLRSVKGARVNLILTT